jgi:hypothetical protein
MSPTRPPRLLLFAVLAAFSGCACEDVPDGALTRCEDALVVPGVVKSDILFVIDDSGSMSQEQENLRANLYAFIQALDAAPIANEFQIGVTTSSVEGYGATPQQAYTSGVPYPDGALVAVGRTGAGVAVPGQLIWSSGTGFGGTRVLAADSPTLVPDFQANVLVGTYGTGREQPFRAARLALSDRVADGTNAGFLRPGARLAIVFVSDEDDCSDSEAPSASNDDACHDDAVKNDPTILDSIPDFVSFLRGELAGERRDVTVAAIVGVDPVTLEPASGAGSGCATAYDQAERFADLVGELGLLRTRTGSICDASFRSVLEDIAGLLVAQSMPLEAAPADWRMLVPSIERSGQRIGCELAREGTPEASGASAVYSPPLEGRPATLTFQGVCELQQGDRVDLQVVCAG